MADNITLNSGTGGDTLAADDVAGVKYPKGKVVFGADDSATDVTTTTGLPVQPHTGAVFHVDDNSTTLSVDDGGGSLTVDNAALSVTGGGVEASAVRVTLASDSTGVLSVDDNGGSLTVDGTVAATQSGTWNVGTVATITNVVHVDDNSSTLSVDDGGGSLTVDGSVSVSGTVTVDSELTTADLDTGAGTDTRAVVGVALAASGGALLLGSANPLPVSDNSGSLTVDNAGTFAVQATIAAGATSIAKAEDVASADADVGVPAMAVRKATPANTSGTDGDYEMLQMSAGRLWTSAVIDTALPAGTAVIGAVKTDQTTHGTTDLVAADITKVAGSAISQGHGTAAAAIRVELPTDGTGVLATVGTVTTVSTVTAVSDAQVQGKAAQDAAASGSPVLHGVVARRARITAMSADGDVVSATGDRYGRTQIVGVDLTVTYLQVTASGDTDLVAAPSSGSRLKLLRIEASNSHASTALTVGLKSASIFSGAVFGKKYLPAAGGLAVWVFPNGHLMCGDAEKLVFNLSGAGTIEVTAYYETVAT